MITVDRSKTNHDLEKQNLVTQFDKLGQYDVYKCSLCGLTGKAYTFTEISFSSKSSKKIYSCPKAVKIEKIRITNCQANGKVFDNLTPGSVHVVVPPPEGYDNSRGVWVMGVGEPVKVLFGEYTEIRDG